MVSVAGRCVKETLGQILSFLDACLFRRPSIAVCCQIGLPRPNILFAGNGTLLPPHGEISMKSMTDEELMDLYQSGDEPAFGIVREARWPTTRLHH